MSAEIKETMDHEEILAFNAKFETYADREERVRVSWSKRCNFIARLCNNI